MISTIALAVMLTQAAPQKLRWDPRVDIPVTSGLVVGWMLSEFAFKKQLAPEVCRWCETNGFDNAVRSVFNPRLLPSPEGNVPAHVASNLVGFAAVPLAMLGLDALLSWRDGVFAKAFLVDMLLILEATLSAQGLNQVVKFAVGRARPYTVGATPEMLAEGRDVPDNTLSFFSGHATFTFALVSSAATVGTLRGYRGAWLLWVVGLPMAAVTSLLRLVADKHWASDILVGSMIGTATGVLMPTLLHGRVGPITARVTPLANGLGVSGQF